MSKDNGGPASDRELLEMAAKAAWHTHLRYCKTHMAMVPEPEGEEALPFSVWNPLTDDGDALRLAAKLMLNVLASTACIVAEDENGVECFEYMYGPEDYTSGWRRAIVRAAAAIGSAM